MAQFDWESLNKEALAKALKLYRPDTKASTPKDGLIAEAKAFLMENTGKIDEFFRRVEEFRDAKTEPKATKKAKEEAGSETGEGA